MFNYFLCFISSFFIITRALCAVEVDFIVGTTSAYAPYVSLDEQGKYVGFDIDIAEELAKKFGRSLVIKDLGSLPSLFLALKQNKIDLKDLFLRIDKDRNGVLDFNEFKSAF